MDRIGITRSTRLKHITYCRDHIRRTLYGHPLHIMFHTAHTAHFFATTCTTGTTMHQQRQRRTMTRTFFGTGFVQDQDTAMVHTSTQHIFFGNIFIGCYNGAHQRTFPHFSQGNRFGC